MINDLEISLPANRLSLPVYSIAFVSAMALAYEILLMRLFSIIQWHHYAYMVISLALLGYGISGAVIALTQQRLLKHFSLVYLLNLYLFGFSSVVCFLLVQAIPFNPEEMLWDSSQIMWLSLAYLILSLPFFFAANAVALAMTRFRRSIARIYAFDLFGAGLGSLAIILLLFMVLPFSAIYILGSFALLITILASWEIKSGTITFRLWLQSKSTMIILAMVVMTIAIWTVSKPPLHLSPYKGLSQALRISGTQIISEHASPLGMLTVIESSTIPFRHAPGLSLNATQEPPLQLGIFTDGDGMSVITRYPDSIEQLGYLNQITSSLPYQISQIQRVLIMGGGTGSDVLQALSNKAVNIEVVELNPQLVKLVREDYADYSGNIYNRSDVTIHTADARGFITGSHKNYDLIQIAMLDTYGPSGSGLYTLHENYLYTVDAIKLYFQHLSESGYLSLTRWISLPPRDTLKLLVTVVDALRDIGIGNPAQHLLLIRSWQTSTLLVKNRPINKVEIAALKQFSDRNAFDVVYYPGIQPQDTNRYNKLRQDDFYEGAQALLGAGRENYISQYKFNLQPATDDSPYYFNFFKWSTLPELYKLRGKGGLPLLEAGYLVLVAVLLQALIASLVLILLPNWFLLRRKSSSGSLISISRIAIYFSSLGLGFLFIEIALIQKFILFLHHPLYAVSIVLSSFLIFSGLGSGWSKRFLNRKTAKQIASNAIAAISLIGIIYLLLLNSLFVSLMALPMWAKILITIGLISPLAFCMGMPFPTALTQLGMHAPERIPWAWGINGCASVVSAVLATLIAIHAGFSMVLSLALLFYLLACYFFPAIAE